MSYGRIMKERFKGKEPILEALKDPRIARTLEDHARSNLQAYVMIDGTFFKVVEKEHGAEKAKDFQKKLWVQWVPELVNDAMKILQIKEVKDITTLGRLLRTIYDLISCPLLTLEDNPERFIGAIYMDPFVEYLPLIAEKIGSPYCQALAEASKARLKAIVDTVGMEDMVEADQDKFMCLGDSFSRIIIRKK